MKRCNYCGKYDNIDCDDYPCDNCEGMFKEVEGDVKI